MLRLEAEAGTLRVDLAALAGDRAIEEVAGVELHSRLRGGHLHRAAGRRLVDAHDTLEPGRRAREDHVVVVAAAEGDLWMIGVNACANRRGLAEVEWRPFDGGEVSHGDEPLVHRRVAVGLDFDVVPEHIAVAGASEVEVRVLRQVDRRGLVGRRLVVEPQRVVVGQGVGDLGLQRARVAHVAVRAGVREHHAHRVGTLEGLGLPVGLVETLWSAVQVVLAVVLRQRVGRAVDGERPLADAVAVAADDGAEEWRLVEVTLEVVVAEHDVTELPCLVGHLQRRDDAAVGDGFHFHPVGVGQREGLDGLAVGQGTERRASHRERSSGRGRRRGRSGRSLRRGRSAGASKCGGKQQRHQGQLWATDDWGHGTLLRRAPRYHRRVRRVWPVSSPTCSHYDVARSPDPNGPATVREEER